MNNKDSILIVIPARYHSTRFPGKPLAHIMGKPMLQWVWETAQRVCGKFPGVQALVATEDQRIMDFCQSQQIPAVLTSSDCESGTERVREALIQLNHPATFIINLQGDNALCPWWFLEALIEAHLADPDKAQVITPYVQLAWSELDALREAKIKTPFSGTCVVYDQQHYAHWFSKQIIPAIRQEDSLRANGAGQSPVARHIGLYGYHRSVLLALPELKSTPYEAYEGLEQLAFLENQIPVKMVEVDYRGEQGMSGVDSPIDITRAEAILKARASS